MKLSEWVQCNFVSPYKQSFLPAEGRSSQVPSIRRTWYISAGSELWEPRARSRSYGWPWLTVSKEAGPQSYNSQELNSANNRHELESSPQSIQKAMQPCQHLDVGPVKP